MPAVVSFLVTCEHGGNAIPVPYRQLFSGHRALLDSHRGYDIGALATARAMSAALGAPLVSSTTSRLLIDLNRSIGHRNLFSAATRSAPPAVRRTIVARHYEPYRAEVERLIAASVARGAKVVHLSSHSFTPVLDGEERRADVGLLYDPGRSGERVLAARWKAALAGLAPALRIRRNYPYAGKQDGLATHLRRRFRDPDYVAIELEVNQRFALTAGRPWRLLQDLLIDSLRAACAPAGHPLPSPPESARTSASTPARRHHGDT